MLYMYICSGKKQMHFIGPFAPDGEVVFNSEELYLDQDVYIHIALEHARIVTIQFYVNDLHLACATRKWCSLHLRY